MDLQFIAQQLIDQINLHESREIAPAPPKIEEVKKDAERISLASYLQSKKSLDQLINKHLPNSTVIDDSESDISISDDDDDDDNEDQQDVILEEGQVVGDGLSHGRNAIINSGEMDDEDSPDAKFIPRTRHEVDKIEIPPLPVKQLPKNYLLYPVGQILAVVDDTVVVQGRTMDGLSGQLPLDEGTLLAFADRSVLGLIFDTFGPITQPLYSIKFNTTADIDVERCVVGAMVYSCPDYVKPIMTEQLKQIKGSDASNLYDEEVGANEAEFSDDEQEQSIKRQNKRKNQHKKQSQSDSLGGQARHVI
ncbi:hypothetical protein MIR68_004584 [Amoeboaphelidium protococcarum]|nr:hypothetical protein MIR68_004584 [Amoeboaphelidium protococcarum]